MVSQSDSNKHNNLPQDASNHGSVRLSKDDFYQSEVDKISTYGLFCAVRLAQIITEAKATVHNLCLTHSWEESNKYYFSNWIANLTEEARAWHIDRLIEDYIDQDDELRAKLFPD